MRAAIIISVLFISIAINAAVFQHHFFRSQQLSSKNEVQTVIESKKPFTPFQFHYVGKEKWTNVFAIYRYNQSTGEILRYSYTIYEEAKDGTPQYDAIEVLNMANGESNSVVSSKDRFLLDLHFKKMLDDESKKKKEKN